MLDRRCKRGGLGLGAMDGMGDMGCLWGANGGPKGCGMEWVEGKEGM